MLVDKTTGICYATRKAIKQDIGEKNYNRLLKRGLVIHINEVIK